jgi:hypothetical protein
MLLGFHCVFEKDKPVIPFLNIPSCISNKLGMYTNPQCWNFQQQLSNSETFPHAYKQVMATYECQPYPEGELGVSSPNISATCHTIFLCPSEPVWHDHLSSSLLTQKPHLGLGSTSGPCDLCPITLWSVPTGLQPPTCWKSLGIKNTRENKWLHFVMSIAIFFLWKTVSRDNFSLGYLLCVEHIS